MKSTKINQPLANRPKCLLYAMLFFLLIMSCSKDDSEKVYEDIDITELIGYIGEPIQNFTVDYNRFYIPSDAILSEPKFEIETLSGNYKVRLTGQYQENSDGSAQTLLAEINGEAVFKNEFPESIDHLAKLVKENFKQLPYSSFVNTETASSPYDIVSNEKVEFSDYDVFYKEMKERGIESIHHTWILENDVVCHLGIGNNRIYFRLSAFPSL